MWRGLDVGGGGGWCMIAVADKASVSSATGVATSTLTRTGTTFGWLGVQIILKPSSAGASPIIYYVTA